MRGRGSIRLFELRGIRVGADLSWFLILFLMIIWLSPSFHTALHSSQDVAYATTVVTVLLFFASLLVHELGHAFVARRQGISVQEIRLFLFGGVTAMGREPASPGEDFKIAAAGPAATLLVVLVCLAADLALVGSHRLWHAATLDGTVPITPVLLALSWLLPMNIIILVFNLLPAFPLDGGRIARAIVWRVTGRRSRGTVIAARMGQGLALVLGGLGLWLTLREGGLSGLWLLALGWLLYQAARGAVVQGQVVERIEGVRVADIMDRAPVAIPGATPLPEALDEYFRRYGWDFFPVVDEQGLFLGVVRQARVEATLQAGEGWLTVAALAEEAEQWRVRTDGDLSEVLGMEALRRLGALMAVDEEGVLRGVVTLRQAMAAAMPAHLQLRS
jgi:Zn-dependent protease